MFSPYIFSPTHVFLAIADIQHWIKQEWTSNSYDRYIINSYLRLPELQRKLSVCKQRGDGGERVVTPPLEGVVHSCS